MTVLRKVLTASAVALVLASVPSHLAAQERESKAPVEVRVGVSEWLSSALNKLAVWFTSGSTTPPHTGSPGGGPTTQGSCAVDPFGTCTPGG
jgi:hypothetical protein